MNHRGQREIAYQMLIQWTEKKDRAATYESLGIALNNVGKVALGDRCQKGKGKHNVAVSLRIGLQYTLL